MTARYDIYVYVQVIKSSDKTGAFRMIGAAVAARAIH
ncbi:hypothetical protein M728_002533 [Ensifer sp. WSM1721]